jgi:hypothetical protein
VAIKVTGRFATAQDVADALGVSKRRTAQLIALADQSLGRERAGDGRSGTRLRAKRKAGSWRGKRNGSSNGSKTKAKR